MSSIITTNPGCECDTVGAGLLKFTRLEFITFKDPLVGASTADVPEGPFNRELAKLHENTCELATHLASWMRRTSAVASGSAPALVSGTPSGAPTTPTSYSYHEVNYDDFVVYFVYDANLGQWTELGRAQKTATTVMKQTKTLTVEPTDGATAISFALPVDDDNNQSIAWTREDIKKIDLYLLDTGAAQLSVTSLRLDGAQLTAYLDTAVGTGSDYELLVVFERITVS